MRPHAYAILLTAIALSGCGGSDDAPTEATPTATAGEARFPTIVKARANRAGPGRYDFHVTVSSPYDSPERYADGWRVLAPDGKVLGEHELAHDHANEQPFTRVQRGVSIRSGIDTVEIEPSDLKNGYGGKRVRVMLP